GPSASTAAGIAGTSPTAPSSRAAPRRSEGPSGDRPSSQRRRPGPPSRKAGPVGDRLHDFAPGHFFEAFLADALLDVALCGKTTGMPGRLTGVAGGGSGGSTTFGGATGALVSFTVLA